MITPAEARQIARHEHAAANAAHPFALPRQAARRPPAVRFPDSAGGTDAHRRNGQPPRQRALMQRYYRTKRAVLQFNAILLQNLHDYLFRETPAQCIR